MSDLTVYVARDTLADGRWVIRFVARPMATTLTASTAELEGLHQALTEIDDHTMSFVSLAGEDDMRPAPLEVQVDGGRTAAALTIRMPEGGALDHTIELDAGDLTRLVAQLARALGADR